MLYDLDLSKILFLDIETVPEVPEYDLLDESQKELWDSKMSYQIKDDKTAGELYERAGIYAEFGKIVCISVGSLRIQGEKKEMRIKSFFGDDEKQILIHFKELLDIHYNTDKHLLCAHNGKEFDFPYIARRMLINDVKLPHLLNIAGKKPWEINHLDTMELWKFGDYKHYTSLNLLTNIFNIPTPKDDISGADVSRVFWQEKDINRIARYCEKDVIATVQLLQKYRGEQLISDENIKIVS
jgi:uncharacterized protein YprB with RNaseH-like and TPR domain